MFVSRATAALFLCILAMRSETAVLKTYDLNTQIVYSCPNSVELSCVVLWKLNPQHGLLGQSENFFRLQCIESPAIDAKCTLPEMFAFNKTKLIKPYSSGSSSSVPVRQMGGYHDSGDFIQIGCKATQSAVCVSLTGQAFRIKETYYIFALRCKDILMKGCRSHSFGIGDKITAILPFTPVTQEMLLTDVL